MRTSHFLVSLCLAFLAACTPLSPNKAKDNSKCFTNADCSSGFCAKGVCTAAVDCSQDANASNSLCQDKACVVDKDCPSSSYYCSAGLCLFGEKPPCVTKADCTDEAKPFCLDQGGADNLCVACLKTADCGKDGGSCIDFACVKDEEGCTGNADCADNEDDLLFCEKKSQTCVECLEKKDCAAKGATFDCRQFKCSEATVVQNCNNAGCPSKKLPICVTSTGVCVGCSSAPAGTMCKNGQTCDSTMGSPTFDECVSPIQPGACGNNSDCKMGLPPTAPTGSTFWCDLGSLNVPAACKECRLGQNDCGAGFTCTTQTGGIEVCAPQTGTPCTTAANCANADDACVNGTCQTACMNSNQCKAGKQCLGSVCVTPSTCTTNASCTTMGTYNGLTCRGAPLSCQPCATNTDCTNGPGGAVNGAVQCNQTTKLCIVPPVTTAALGAVCADNADCTSGVCHDFGDGYPPICVSMCQRTATTVSAPNNDCPTAPDASLVGPGARPGLPSLNANQGFRCATVSGSTPDGFAYDGLGLCLHAVDIQGVFGVTGVSGLSGAYTKAAGVTETSGANCQFGFVINQNGSTVCAAGCGTNTDCDSLTPNEDEDFVCSEVLTQIENSEVALGIRACFDNTSAKAEGQFCDQATDCRENFCAGTCVATLVQRIPLDTCNTDAGCVSGDKCIGGRCYRSTLRAGSSCADDSECSGTDRCWNGKCYAPEAETDRLCQDRYSCGDSTLQICAGRCASHCNEQSDCAAAPDQVCAYAPGAPGLNPAGTPTFIDGFVGESWTRVCANPTAAPAGASFDHFLKRNQQCNDDTECESQVCVDSRCTDFCGRSGICEVGEQCALVPRSVAPNDASTLQLLLPVCVIP